MHVAVFPKLFIGVLMKKKEKEKKKDNQYKLKKVMAIAIGLTKTDSYLNFFLPSSLHAFHIIHIIRLDLEWILSSRLQ